MLKMIFITIILFGLVYFGINWFFNETSASQKWILTKKLFYSIICISATVGLIALIIITF